MSPLHANEKVVEEALMSISSGPWTAADLEKIPEIIDDDWCGRHGPECTLSGVLGWLGSLNDDAREELLFKANTEWNTRQDPWSLG